MAIKRRGQLARDDSNYPVGWNYFYIHSATTANIANNPGIVHMVIVGNPVNTDNFQLYDGTSVSGATIANINMYSSVGNVFQFDAVFTAGLYLVTNNNSSHITVSYISADK